MRKLLWFLLIPAVLLVGGYFYLQYTLRQSIRQPQKKEGEKTAVPDTLQGKSVSAADLRPLLIKRLQQLVQKSSNGLYRLSITNLDVDVLAGSVLLQGVALQPDSSALDSLRRMQQLPNDVISVRFDSLRLDGISPGDVLTTKTMEYDLIKLVRPVISIHHVKQPVEKDVAQKEDFAQRFLKEMQSLSIKKMIVEGGTVNLYNDVKKGPPVVLKQVAVTLNRVQLDSVTRLDKRRFLFADSAFVSFKDYKRTTKDGLYQLKIGQVQLTAPRNNVTLAQFSFTSPYTRTQFSKRQKQSTELYNVTLPRIQLQNVNWWALLNDEAIMADNLTTTGGRVSIFLDRSLPPRNRMGNFPSQLLMKLPLKLQIAKAALKNLDVSYAEYNPNTKGTGTIYLDNTQLQISNLANTNRDPLSITGTTRFMHAVPVAAQFQFDMNAYKTGRFNAHIKTGNITGAQLNPFTVPMALLKLERGTLQSAESTVQGNEQQASGTVRVRYNDLKLAILEKDAPDKAPDKKDVTSLLANLLLLKKDNPKKGEPLRVETAAFERIPEGGFFMLVWKTILVGTLKTIGAPTKIASKTASSAANE